MGNEEDRDYFVVNRLELLRFISRDIVTCEGPNGKYLEHLVYSLVYLGTPVIIHLNIVWVLSEHSVQNRDPTQECWT